MAVVAGAAIAAGASLAGGAIGAFGANSARKAQKAEAERNREFQRSFYQHRYQWQMEDMRRAGLNPILSYKMGAPGGASPSSVSPVNVGAPIQEGLGRAVSSALAVKRQDEEIKNLQAQRTLLKTQNEAEQGKAAAARQEVRAYKGDKGFAYWLLNNGKGSTWTRLFGTVLGLAPEGGSAKSKHVDRYDLLDNGKQKREPAQHSSFGSWMLRKRKQVFGSRKKKAANPGRYDWQKGGLPK